MFVDPSDIPAAETALAEAKSLADAARERIADANQVVADAQSALESTTATFKAKPTAGNATAKLVCEQQLENAKEACQKAVSDARPVIVAEGRARQLVTYAKGSAEVALYAAESDKDVAAIVALEAATREAVERLTRRCASVGSIIREVHQAAEELGLPLPMPSVSVDPNTLPQRVRAAIRAKYGHTTPTSIHRWIAVEG